VRRSGLLAACALLLATNLVVLLGVGYNRSGEPEARLVLTERELRPGYVEKENTGLWLRLEATDVEPWKVSGPGWFDQKKLEGLGFDCSVPVEKESAELFYEKALPRHVFAVLELDGDAWRTYIAAREQDLLHPPPGRQESRSFEERQKSLEAERVGHSRLFVIDVGRDREELRRRYADREHFIVSGAVARLSLQRSWDDKTKTWKDARLEGYVSEILPSEIHVPLGMRKVLDDLRAQAKPDGSAGWLDYSGYMTWLQGPPRYQVTLRYGRRLEPWIESIEALSATAR